MLVPLTTSVYEFTVKKSRFIATLIPVASGDEARNIVRETRKEHPGCRHVVHAFVTGRQGELPGMSDDGEPAGTAGKPVLAILKGSGLTETLITVVRYFGGIKLGTGGLVKAYAQAARGALAGAETRALVRRSCFSLSLPYSLYDGFRKLSKPFHIEVINEDFTGEIVISARLPYELRSDFIRQIGDLSAGQVEISWGDDIY